MEHEKIYKYTAAYARENEALDAYRRSRITNIECRKAIETAVRENFDGQHLNADTARGVMEQFGPERLSFILAATVEYKSFDGRFSPATKAWASHIQQDIVEKEGMDECVLYLSDRDAVSGYVVNTHPAILDGFINQTRRELARLAQPKEKETEVHERPSVKQKLKSMQSQVRGGEVL